MTRIKPYQGTSHTRLSQLIRSSQVPPLPSSTTFTFGPVREGTQPVPGATEIDVAAHAGTRHDAAVTVNYKRLSAEALKRLPAGEIVPFDPMTFPTTMHAILPQINNALGLNLVANEVLDVALPSIPENGITITITASSLAWLAGEYLFPYAPNADRPAGRGAGGAIPTDEQRRIRLLELPVDEPAL